MRVDFTSPGFARLRLNDGLVLWLPESLREISRGSVPGRRPTQPAGGALSDPAFATRALALIEKNRSRVGRDPDRYRSVSRAALVRLGPETGEGRSPRS
jgi:hypothetical protein